MGFRHLIHLIVIISTDVVYAADSDSTSFLSNDLLFPDTGFSSSPETLAFNLPDFSLPFGNTDDGNLFSSGSVDLEDPDKSDLFLSNNIDLNDDNYNDLFFHDAGLDNEPIQLADCSSSEVSPPTGRKSRIRRGDACVDGSGSGSAGPLKTDNISPADVEEAHPLKWYASEQEYEKRQNEGCRQKTGGVLPFGVCHVETAVDLEPTGTTVLPSGDFHAPFTSYVVDPGTLGKSSSLKARAKGFVRFVDFWCACVCA